MQLFDDLQTSQALPLRVAPLTSGHSKTDSKQKQFTPLTDKHEPKWQCTQNSGPLLERSSNSIRLSWSLEQ